MKNITVSVDEETYRQARIAAAKRDASVSALVRGFLRSLDASEAGERDRVTDQNTLLDALWEKYPGFTASENLDRDALHSRR